MFHNFVILYDSYKYHFYKIIPSGTSWSSSKLGSNWSNCGNFSVRGKTNASDSVSVSDRCEIRREIVASESELISSTYLKYNNRYFGVGQMGFILRFVSYWSNHLFRFASTDFGGFYKWSNLRKSSGTVLKIIKPGPLSISTCPDWIIFHPEQQHSNHFQFYQKIKFCSSSPVRHSKQAPKFVLENFREFQDRK